MSFLSIALQQIINGLQAGSIYALVALGYSMVYGIIMLLNFAHGDIIMVGAYMAWLAMARFALHPLIAVLAAAAACTILGMSIEKVAYKPLRGSPRISLLITAIGISFLLENLSQLIFGAGAKSVPALFSSGSVRLGQAEISNATLITLLVTAVSMIVLTLLVSRTKMGKAMRAVSEDTGAAQLMGININRTISAIASILYCAAYPQATPTMGSMLGLKAFVAAVLGGIGSIPGAMIGGFAIGLAEALVSAVGLSVWKDGVVFAILIIVLIVKPTGIMGHPMQEKV